MFSITIVLICGFVQTSFVSAQGGDETKSPPTTEMAIISAQAETLKVMAQQLTELRKENEELKRRLKQLQVGSLMGAMNVGAYYPVPANPFNMLRHQPLQFRGGGQSGSLFGGGQLRVHPNRTYRLPQMLPDTDIGSIKTGSEDDDK